MQALGVTQDAKVVRNRIITYQGRRALILDLCGVQDIKLAYLLQLEAADGDFPAIQSELASSQTKPIAEFAQ